MIAVLGATTLTFGCTKVYGNPKQPPPDAPPGTEDARTDGPPDDAGVDAIADAGGTDAP